MAFLRYFGLFRTIPEESYTFYSYSAYAFVTKKHRTSNRRTLDTLKEFWGYLIEAKDPDAFEPIFQSSEY